MGTEYTETTPRLSAFRASRADKYVLLFVLQTKKNDLRMRVETRISNDSGRNFRVFRAHSVYSVSTLLNFVRSPQCGEQNSTAAKQVTKRSEPALGATRNLHGAMEPTRMPEHTAGLLEGFLQRRYV